MVRVDVPAPRPVWPARPTCSVLLPRRVGPLAVLAADSGCACVLPPGHPGTHLPAPRTAS